MEKHINKEKLNEYFLEKLGEEDESHISLLGWKVLGVIDRSRNKDFIYSCSEYYTFHTLPNSWPTEFWIVVQTKSNNTSQLMVLVSPECPEVYFAAPEEIINPIKEVLGIGETYKTLTTETLLEKLKEVFGEEWEKDTNITTTSSPYNPYNPFSYDWEISSTAVPRITFNRYDSLSSAQNRINEIQDNEVFFAQDTGSLYVKCGNNFELLN